MKCPQDVRKGDVSKYAENVGQGHAMRVSTHTCLRFPRDILWGSSPIRTHRPYGEWKARFVDDDVGRVNLNLGRPT